MSQYVAVVKDSYARLSKSSLFVGTLEQVLAQLVEHEWISPDQGHGELKFHEGACALHSETDYEVAIFET